MPDKNVSHNNQKKIAAINDYSGFGRCSIAVELPVISAMKIQCCPMPTSIFSNHTGFDSFYFKDFTENMPPYMAEWKKLNLKFDCVNNQMMLLALLTILNDLIDQCLLIAIIILWKKNILCTICNTTP